MARISLSQGASYTYGKDVYLRGKSYSVSEATAQKLSASGHFNVSPDAKEENPKIQEGKGKK